MNFDKLNYLAKTLLSAQNESQREYCYLLQIEWLRCQINRYFRLIMTSVLLSSS